jgi:hypothetical protein
VQLVCISRGEQEKGKRFAQQLAAKLTHECLSQEEVAEIAIREGVAVGKLETAAVKKHQLSERQVLEKEHYQALFTRVLCERALKGSLVFHGRAGHLAVPGLSSVLRIRTEIDTETRVEEVMSRLSLDRARAKVYVENVDEDISRWIRTIYNVSGSGALGHDLVVNLGRVDVGGATTATCAFAQLPEFQTTPASIKVLDDLLLAARVRIALARDKRTWAAGFRVQADAGHVTVSYLPRDSAVGRHASEVVAEIPGVMEQTCAMVASNILWVQDRFQATGATFEAIVKAARHWHSAVEFVKLTHDPTPPSPETTDGDGAGTAASKPLPLFTTRKVDGGIEEDVAPVPGRFTADGELREIFGELNARGIAASASRLPDDLRRIQTAIDQTIPYSLVVVGDVFLDQGQAARVRKQRELVGRLADVVKAPVVNAEDLGQMVHTGWVDYAKMVALAGVVAAMFLVIFNHQEEVLRFFSPATIGAKIAAAAVLLVFVPLFAAAYGTLAKAVLKVFHVE